MEAFQHQPQGITLEQYERFPEDYRVEVFDGAVYHMSSPSQTHQTILTELLVSLRGYIKEKSGNCSVFPSPFDVKLNDDPLTIVQPDLMVVCDKTNWMENAATEPQTLSLRSSLPQTRQTITSGSCITTKIMAFVNIGSLTHNEKV